MRPLILFAVLVALLIAPLTRAEDAADFRDKGIAALKESQSNPRAIVDAARHFVKAADLYAAAGNDEKSVEMNSFLYWCKKKMSMQDIDAFVQGGESAVSNKLTAVEKLAPQADDAQKFFDRAEQFAQQNPAEHLLIAIRFYEVAGRFKGSDAALQAMDRSLKEQLLDKSSAAKTNAPPVAVAAPKLAPETSGSQPVPPPDKIKDAEKTIKELFKAEYAQTDATARLALAAKLLQQADENKNDPAAEYVVLRDARDFAIIAGDAAQAAAAHKRLCASFKLDFAAILADLHRLEPTAKSAEAATALVKLARSSADDALEADNFDQAVRFNSHVEDLLPLLKDAALKARLKSEIAYAQALNRDSAPALAAIKTLSTTHDDPDANLVAGKFALERGKFEQAFALLAKGKDATLSDVAKRELAPPTEAAEQIKLADGWFDCAEKETYSYLKIPLQERAATWYRNVLPAVTGLPKVKVETRLKMLSHVANTNDIASKSRKGTLFSAREVSFDLGAGITMEMVLIPAGTFQMGSPEGEAGRSRNEKQHTVTISQPFYMGKYPVTQEQYKAVTGKTPSAFKDAKNPVEMVSWDEAEDFCKTLQNQVQTRLPKGMELQLPTEAQWEYACRAGTKTRYYSGDEERDLAEVAWFKANSSSMTHPVGKKKPNAFGLFDMHGNVWQWCRDSFTDDYLKLNPTDPLSDVHGADRVLRAGAWNNTPNNCRSTKRLSSPPGKRDKNNGFRVVVSVAGGG